MNHSIKQSLKWKQYCQLELIPESVHESFSNSNSLHFSFGITHAWRVLIIALLQELVLEQQVEYLERCWQLAPTTEAKDGDSPTLQRLWTLMN